MLGVQRPTVSNAAGPLQDAGLIRYRHGHVRIENRGGLEQRTCECYSIIRLLYEETFESVPAKVAKLSSSTNGNGVPRRSIDLGG